MCRYTEHAAGEGRYGSGGDYSFLAARKGGARELAALATAKNNELTVYELIDSCYISVHFGGHSIYTRI
jgi:hypothetical protein